MSDTTINNTTPDPTTSTEALPINPVEITPITPTSAPEGTAEVMPKPAPVFILKDINGGSFQIPNTLPWGKEKKVLSIVGKAFKELMPKKEDKDNKKIPFDAAHFMNYVNENFDLDGEVIKSFENIALAYASEEVADTKINVEELLQFFAIQAPGIITTLISVITGKSEADIDEQYAGDSVLAFAVPYVIYAMQKYAGSFMSNF